METSQNAYSELFCYQAVTIREGIEDVRSLVFRKSLASLLQPQITLF